MTSGRRRFAPAGASGSGTERRPVLPSILVTVALFVCVFTSADWTTNPASADGEILRLDSFFLFEQVTVYYLVAAFLCAALFFAKFAPRAAALPRTPASPSFLKPLLWLFFLPLNIIIYVTVVLESIDLQDLGVNPVIEFGTMLVVIYYVQDVYLEGGTAGSLRSSLTLLQVLITIRCAYTIGKYAMGRGMPWPGGGVRLGQENDLADFFVLLFIIALTRLLVDGGGSAALRALHLAGAGMVLTVAVVSERRYLQWEVFIAAAVVFAAALRSRRGLSFRQAIGAGLTLSVVFGSLLFIGPSRLAANRTIGRFLTGFSLVSDRYSGRFGTDTGHQAEIRDGWMNVKAHWLLGVTPFGGDKIRKYETRDWQEGYFFHNAYLYVWLIYGLLGLILFLSFYLLSLRLGATLFLRHGDSLGLIVGVFMICQLVKNIVWLTAFYFMNVTIVYLFIVSLAWKAAALQAPAERGAVAVRPQGVYS